MARTQKQGIDYFSLDVNFDTQLEIIIEKNGIRSLGIITRIWQHIYKHYGYFMPYNEDELYIIKKQCSTVNEQPPITIDEIDSIILQMVDRKMFNDIIFKESAVLTSQRLQSNYKSATRNRKSNEILTEYLLKPSVSITDEMPQRKLNESKLNKKKVNESKEDDEFSNSPEAEAPGSQIIVSKKIDYNDIANYWNKNSMLKEITKITPNRKKHIDARIKESSLETIYTVINIISKSSFLRGNNNRNFVGSFEWVFKNTENFTKTLEGKYSDKVESNNTNKKIDERIAKARAMVGG